MEDIVKNIHDIVLADRRVKIKEIADIVDICTESIQNILHEKLGMRKLSARWLPRLLTVEKKRNRMTNSEHCLDMFKRNPKEFLRRFVTVDESIIGSITTRQKGKNSQNSGLHPANVLQRRGKVFRKGHGHRFLEFASHYVLRLSGEGKGNHGALLC